MRPLKKFLSTFLNPFVLHLEAAADGAGGGGGGAGDGGAAGAGAGAPAPAAGAAAAPAAGTTPAAGTGAAAAPAPAAAAAPDTGAMIGADGKFTPAFAKAYPALASKFTEPDAAFKSYSNLERMLSAQNKITPITATSTPEERAAFNKAMGVPDKPEGYEITKPKELNGKPFPDAMWDEAGVKSYLAKFHELGIPKAAAQELIKFGMQEGVNKFQSLSDIVEQSKTAGVTALKKEWGANYDANVVKAERGAQALGLTADMVKADPTLANSPAFVKMCLAAAEMTREGTSPGARGAQNTPADPTARIGELQRLMSDKNYTRSPAYKDHASNMEEMQRLVAEKHAARQQGN